MQFHTTINDWHTCPASGRDPRLEPVLGIHVPRRHGLQSRLAEPAAVPRRATAAFDVAAFEHAVRLWTIVLEISVLMAQFPSKEIAELSYDYRTLGLGYANIGGLLMSSGIPYDSDEGRAHLRRAHRDHDRRRLCHLGRDGGRARRLPRLRPRTASACCASSATIAAPPMATRDGYEGLRDPPGAARRRRLPRPAPGRRAAQAAWDAALDARREARLPQRPGDGDRADRHDRPGHGLRHHRHRARLRAGQVQEARRRRLFQDHQPRRAARRCATLGYARGADRRDRSPMRVGHGTLDGRARHQPRQRSGPRASPTRRSPTVEAALAVGLRHQVRLQQVDARARTSASRRSASRRARSTIPRFDLLAALGFSRAEIEAANIYVCGAMTSRARRT